MALPFIACKACGKPVRSAKGCGCGGGPSSAQRTLVAAAASPIAPKTEWHVIAFEGAIERRFRQFAFPIALLVFWGLVHTGLPHLLVRTVFSMWIHELGHAAAAWLCGRFAFPGPWFTPVAEHRSWLVVVTVFCLLGWGIWRWWQSRRLWAVVLGLLIPAQLYCTFLLLDSQVRTFIVWAGDGGCMVVGTLLMLSFYAGKHTQLRVGWLRWGFLVIGAAALTDPLATWWAARTDRDAIPFGENEGRGLSDPTVLVYEQGFSIPGLVNSYLATAALCFAVLLVGYLMGLRRAADSPRGEGL